ncbi:MAG: hypothetical protein EOM05_02855 [Clostridia bacterium]|nr:hypothetical protein [Clostridia bacterium]
MKKTLMAIFISVILIMLSVLPAFAAYTKYTLDEFNMIIEVPEDFATLTRDVKDSDPNIALFDFKSSEEVVALLKKYNAYLNTSPKNGEYGILFTMTADKNSQGVFDLNLLSEKELQKMIDKALKLNSNKIEYSDYDVYQHKQAKFIIFHGMIKDGTQSSYITQYFTIYNGQTININLYSYIGPASESAELKQREIVDKITFTKTVERPFSVFHLTGKSSVDNSIVGVSIVAIIAIISGVPRLIKRNNERKRQTK